MNIAELRRLEAEATPGAWFAEGNSIKQESADWKNTSSVAACVRLGTRSTPEAEANAALIVAMRNSLPELLLKAEEHDSLVAALQRLSTYEAFTTAGWGHSHPEITERIMYAKHALAKLGGRDVG